MRFASLSLAAGLALSLLGSVSCDSKSDQGYLKPFAKTVVDSDTEFDPRVDVLFVIDDSGSMSGHQKNLADNIKLFTQIFLKKSVLNYNIGVINTSAEDSGHLIGLPKYVTKLTPNADDVLAKNLIVGTSGSAYERPFATTELAMSPGNLSGFNNGFLRPEAALVVIFITDAEDQSDGLSAQRLYDELVALKGGDSRRLLAYGAIVPTVNTGPQCPRDDNSMTPVKIETFLSLVSNAPDNVLNLCDPSFGSTLGAFAAQIVERTSLTIYLTRQPDPDTIRVTYGQIDLPNDKDIGWTYDAYRNAIQLGKQIDWEAQPPGSRVRVYYKKAKVDEEDAKLAPKPAPTARLASPAADPRSRS